MFADYSSSIERIIETEIGPRVREKIQDISIDKVREAIKEEIRAEIQASPTSTTSTT